MEQKDKITLKLNLKQDELDGLSGDICFNLVQTFNGGNFNKNVKKYFGTMQGHPECFVLAIQHNNNEFYIEVFNYETCRILDFVVMGSIAYIKSNIAVEEEDGIVYAGETISYYLQRIIDIVDVKQSPATEQEVEQTKKEVNDNYIKGTKSLLKRVLVNDIFNPEEQNYFDEMTRVLYNIIVNYKSTIIATYMLTTPNFTYFSEDKKLNKILKKVQSGNTRVFKKHYTEYMQTHVETELADLYSAVLQHMKASDPFGMDYSVGDFVKRLADSGVFV